MKLVTWNVNGIRTLLNYSPWNQTKSYKDLLDSFEADIVCFQEHKLVSQKVTCDVALVEGYDSYYTTSSIKNGYSGVVTFVKSELAPLNAYHKFEDFIEAQQCPIRDLLRSKISSLDLTELKELELEGRLMILEFERVFVINVYVPHIGTERFGHHFTFIQILFLVCDVIYRNLSKEIILLGDINISHREIDHYSPGEFCKDHELEHFDDHPSKQFLSKQLIPNGCFVDLFRHYFPERRNAYTCWNTRLNLRPLNLGTRIDYVLITEGLLPFASKCNLRPHIYGSDHCPVEASFQSRHPQTDRTAFEECFASTKARSVLTLNSKSFLKSRQKKLLDFFSNAQVATSSSSPHSSNTITQTAKKRKIAKKGPLLDYFQCQEDE